MITKYYSINNSWKLNKPVKINPQYYGWITFLSQYEFTLIKDTLNQSNNLSECLIYLHDKLWVTKRINNINYENLVTALIKMEFRITVSQSKKTKQLLLPYNPTSTKIHQEIAKEKS